MLMCENFGVSDVKCFGNVCVCVIYIQEGVREIVLKVKLGECLVLFFFFCGCSGVTGS